MKFLQKNLLAVILVILAVLGVGYYLNSNKVDRGTSSGNTTENTDQSSQKFAASLEINDGKSVQHYDLVEGEGDNALEVTKKATGGQVVTKGEGEMAYVTAINGREAKEADKEYWELLVNGKSSEVGAGSYKLKFGDKIEWRISTY